MRETPSRPVEVPRMIENRGLLDASQAEAAEPALGTTEVFYDPILERRKKVERVFRVLAQAGTWSTVLILFVLLAKIGYDGLSYVSWDFVNGFPSRFAHKAGIKPAIFGTVWLMALTALISIPLGVAAAVYLEEYAPKNRVTRLIELNIANLAGTPSIVMGLLGLAVFVRFAGLGSSLLAGALTLSLLILPIIIIASREALRAVPDTIRQGAYAVGATKWQTTWGQTIPAATPGILTGIILALSRAIGETAPLIVVGAVTYAAFVPSGPGDQYTALPIQIFNWSSRPQEEFHGIAAAGIIVLLAVMLLMNFAAIVLRQRYSRKFR